MSSLQLNGCWVGQVAAEVRQVWAGGKFGALALGLEGLSIGSDFMDGGLLWCWYGLCGSSGS